MIGRKLHSVLTGLMIAFPCLSYAQGDVPKVIISGDVQHYVSGQLLSGVTVELFNDGQLLETKTTSSNGKFKFKPVEIFKNYKVLFKGTNLVSRYVDFELKNIPPEETYKKWDLELPMKMIDRLEGIDFSLLEPKRSSVVKFNSTTGELDFSSKEISSYKSELDKLLAKKEKDKKEKDEQFATIINEATQAEKNKNYQLAISKYEEAIGLKQSEKGSIDPMLNKVRMAYENHKQEIAQQKKTDSIARVQNEIKTRIAMGDQKLSLNKFDEAIAEYKKALAMDFNNASAKSKIQQATQSKEKYELALVNKPIKDSVVTQPVTNLPSNNILQYNTAMDKGKNELTKGNFELAISSYQEALKFKPNDADASKQLKRANDLKTETDGRNKRLYNDMIKVADDLFKQGSYADARSYYERAIKNFKLTDNYASNQVKECNKKLNPVAQPNLDYTLNHQGKIVTGSQVEEGYNLLANAYANDTYEAGKFYAGIHNKQAAFYTSKTLTNTQQSYDKQAQLDKNQFERSKGFENKDWLRLEKVDSTVSFTNNIAQKHRDWQNMGSKKSYTTQQKLDSMNYGTVKAVKQVGSAQASADLSALEKGVHQWIVKYNDSKNKPISETTRRIVVGDSGLNKYEMTKNKWGTAFTKDGKTISEHQWNLETNVATIILH